MMIVSRTEVLDCMDACLPFLVVDLDSEEIVYVSRPVEMLFDWQMHNELLGKSIMEVIPKQDQAQHRDNMKRCLVSPARVYPIGTGVVENWKRRSGEIFPATVAMVSLVLNSRRCAIKVVLAQNQQEQ